MMRLSSSWRLQVGLYSLAFCLWAQNAHAACNYNNGSSPNACTAADSAAARANFQARYRSINESHISEAQISANNYVDQVNSNIKSCLTYKKQIDCEVEGFEYGIRALHEVQRRFSIANDLNNDYNSIQKLSPAPDSPTPENNIKEQSGGKSEGGAENTQHPAQLNERSDDIGPSFIGSIFQGFTFFVVYALAIAISFALAYFVAVFLLPKIDARLEKMFGLNEPAPIPASSDDDVIDAEYDEIDLSELSNPKMIDYKNPDKPDGY